MGTVAPNENIKVRVDVDLAQEISKWVEECKRAGVRGASKSSVIRAALKLTFMLIEREPRLREYFIKLVDSDAKQHLARMTPWIHSQLTA